MNAPKGYYRQLLPNMPMVRIAFTHTPIIGCTKVDSEKVIKVLEKSTDQHAQYYIDGLKSGSMVTIVEGDINKYFAVGELYFNS